jgi:methyl-accepting chemotaxis protein
MNIRGLNLQKKAVSIVAVILFGALAVNTAVLSYVASSKFKNAILGRTSAVGESLQRELSKVLGLGVPVESLEGVSEKLKDLTSVNKSIGYAMVTDANAKILFHGDAGKVGKELTDKPSRTAASSPNSLIQAMGEYFDLSFPLQTADGKVVGALRLGVTMTSINSQLYVLLLWALGISVLCFVLATVLVSSFISRVITKPILAIETAADRIASGDLSSEINVQGDDEIASLGHAINRMSGNLKGVLSKIGGITKSVSAVTAKIASASHGVTAATEIQKKAVEETTSAIEEMDSSVVRVATISNNLAVSATDTSSSVLELSASIERTRPPHPLRR